MYRYFNICSSPRYESSLPPEDVLRCILGAEKLAPKSPDTFEYSDESAWFLVLLLHCDRRGNYRSSGQIPEQINLVEVIAGTGSEKAASFARTVADRLGWLVMDVTNE